jgi:hypothetical protein
MLNYANRALDAAEVIFSGDAGLKISLENLYEQQGREVLEAAFQLERRFLGTRPAERDSESRLPRVSLSLRRLTSKGAERLASASATASVQIEVSVSAERADTTHAMTSDYIDAVLDVLSRNRGLWAGGVYYAGEFAVEVRPLAKGGLNYAQSCVFEIEIHLWQE